MKRAERLPEVGLVWALFAVVAVEIFVTYARLPAERLYHVTGSGVEGGASRALVFLNFPVALVTIAVMLVVLDRLEAPLERCLAWAAIGLCCPLFFGVVDQAHLDARPVNAVAAVGVGLGLALTVRSVGCGLVAGLVRRPGDRVRLVFVLASALVVAS